MPYLTYSEYNQLGHSEVANDEFDTLLLRASEAVDSVTRSFYAFNNLADDVKFRRDQFKKAVASQINYFIETGSTTTEGLNNTPQSFSAGRTSVTEPSRHNSAGKNDKRELVSDDVFMHLINTGLLYKGLPS